MKNRHNDNENGNDDSYLYRIIVSTVLGLLALVIIGMFGIPAYSRYQNIQDATNKVRVSEIEISNQSQLIEIENKKAEIRVADAKGIAESQRIINSSLTPYYLQYLAIQAQMEMAHGTNHTQIYIPSGSNGIPLVVTANPDGTPVADPDAKK